MYTLIWKIYATILIFDIFLTEYRSETIIGVDDGCACQCKAVVVVVVILNMVVVVMVVLPCRSVPDSSPKSSLFFM